MWNFIKSLLSNRLGIVMAMLNICAFLYLTQDVTLGGKLESIIVVSLNAPALAFAKIFIEIVRPFVTSYADLSYAPLFIDILRLYFSFFILVQWLFIGRIAKIIARKINLANVA